MSKLIILQGPPASGKSTWAREQAKAHPKTTVIVNRDSIRRGLGEYWVPEREQLVTDIETLMVQHSLASGYDVIVDATNLNPRLNGRWVELGKTWTVEYKTFWAPLDECIARDQNENREQHVGKNVIRYFFERYNLKKR